MTKRLPSFFLALALSGCMPAVPPVVLIQTFVDVAGAAPLPVPSGFVLAGVADYMGKPLAAAPVTVYMLGTTTPVGSGTTGADGSFAVMVTGVVTGELLEVVTYGGGHVLAAVALPRDKAQAGGARYGRLALTVYSTLITAAFADSFAKFGVQVFRKQRSDMTKVHVIYDTFVNRRDELLLARLAADTTAWPVAGIAGKKMPSFVDALREHVSVIKAAVSIIPPKALYRLRATGENSSPLGLAKTYGYCTLVYIGANRQAFLTASEPTEPGDDVPKLTDEEVKAIEKEIHDTRGAPAGPADDVAGSVVTFFKDLRPGQDSFNSVTEIPETPRIEREPETPLTTDERDLVDREITASGTLNITEGELENPAGPITLGDGS